MVILSFKKFILRPSYVNIVNKIKILKIKKEKRNTLNLHLSNQKQHKLNLHLLHYLIESELERNSNEKESFNHNFPNFNTLCPDLKQKKKKNITIILTSIYIITEHAHRFHNNNNNNNLHWFQLKKEQRKPPRPCKVLGNLQRKFALNDLEVHVERQSAEVF